MRIEIVDDCPRCSEYAVQGSTAQNFEYNCDPESVAGPPTYWFDVDGAREIVSAAPRAPYIIDPHTLPPNTRDNLIEEHVAHVPLDEPGIIATVSFEMRGGGRETFNLLIDGRHRAERARREARPFRAYLLTEEETSLVMTTDITQAIGMSLARFLGGKVRHAG